MRYVRFLKSPRVVTDKATLRKQVTCLVTITSDLGDSFLPYDIQLAAELLVTADSRENVLIWSTVQWTAGMRSLPITFPLPKSQPSLSHLRVRVGGEPKRTHDELAAISESDARGVVSAWSPPFTSDVDAPKLVERRFKLLNGPITTIWEETGESIARHLWDAGITLSCQITALINPKTELARALLPPASKSPLNVLELGTGCGMVGIAVAQTIPNSKVLLTDLHEAREIVERNMHYAVEAPGASLDFMELDWDADLPDILQSTSERVNLVLAADCTYNPDSSPTLVNTLTRLVKVNPDVVIAIAMKMRHSSEEVFFELMENVGFMKIAKMEFPLPGDVEVGEEIVHLHVYKATAR
ncbi:hypothetical protein G6011_01623 [Alternaria panax]|uniref:Methyltransferase-domain-containing protein n=1 Tax=Alternaria panax TaxID=48097 RepID=A0AAD4IKZ4_9PLEO|nr:hypothetical protein G6011_01623 [Alternaria panax]